MRLIDADALIKELHEALDGSGYDEDYVDMGIYDFVLSQKTAYDVEKVITELKEQREILRIITRELEELQNYACFPTEWVTCEQSEVHTYYAKELTKILKYIESESDKHELFNR